MKVVSLSLELSRGVHFVGHDPGNGLLHILHPFKHLLMTHVIDILDEVVIFLPESHFDWCSIPYKKVTITIASTFSDIRDLSATLATFNSPRSRNDNVHSILITFCWFRIRGRTVGSTAEASEWSSEDDKANYCFKPSHFPRLFLAQARGSKNFFSSQSKCNYDMLLNQLDLCVSRHSTGRTPCSSNTSGTHRGTKDQGQLLSCRLIQEDCNCYVTNLRSSDASSSSTLWTSVELGCRWKWAQMWECTVEKMCLKESRPSPIVRSCQG